MTLYQMSYVYREDALRFRMRITVLREQARTAEGEDKLRLKRRILELQQLLRQSRELADLLGIKVAAIRDNDGDYAANCVANYADHVSASIQVFADEDNARHTFEVCMYRDNQAVCDELFAPGRKKPGGKSAADVVAAGS